MATKCSFQFFFVCFAIPCSCVAMLLPSAYKELRSLFPLSRKLRSRLALTTDSPPSIYMDHCTFVRLCAQLFFAEEELYRNAYCLLQFAHTGACDGFDTFVSVGCLCKGRDIIHM